MPARGSALAAATVLGLVAAASGAAPPGVKVNRAIRREKNNQNTVAVLTTKTATDLREVNDEYRFNGLVQEGALRAIEAVAAVLEGLADPKASERDRNMPWVVTKLGTGHQADEAVSKRKALLEASGGQGWIVEELTKLLAKARKEFGRAMVGKLLQDVIEKQERVKEETRKLGEETLGKAERELTQEERAERDRLSEQQRSLQQDLQAAKEELRQTAEDLKQNAPEQAGAIEEALQRMDQEQVGDQMREAARDIEQNHTSAAEQKQQDILDALRDAQRQASDYQQSPMSQMQQQMSQLQDMAQRQEELLDDARNLDANSQQMDYNDLQADQQDLRSELGQMLEQNQQQGQHEQSQHEKGLEQAHQEMGKAAKGLEEQKKEPSVGAMEKALENLKQAQAQLAQEMQQMMQQQMAQAHQGQKPGKPEKQPGKPQQEQPDSQALKTQEYDPKIKKAVYGEEKQQSNSAWMVGLEPKDRETLTTAAKEKFPPGYERLLSLYYRNLAAGGSVPEE